MTPTGSSAKNSAPARLPPITVVAFCSVEAGGVLFTGTQCGPPLLEKDWERMKRLTPVECDLRIMALSLVTDCMNKRLPQNNRSRLVDVAAAARVSTATVSHVVNNTRYVSGERRKAVLLAVKRLHYSPSQIARSLTTRQTRTVGVIISDIQNPFYGPLIRGIEEVLLKSDYHILLASNDEDFSKENLHLKTFLSKRVDGLILTPASGNTTFLKAIESGGTKVVCIDRVPRNNPFASVVVDNRFAARKLISHLIEDGQRSIAIICGVAQSTISARLQGYKDALRAKGISFRASLVVDGGSQQKSGYDVTKSLLKKKPRPTAIFATNNLMALGALFAIREMGLKCPEEVALVGFDDTSWAPVFSPPLTMVSQPVSEMGTTAANLLLGQLRGDTKPKVVELKSVLQIRGSCSFECLSRYRMDRGNYGFPEYPFPHPR